MLCVVMLTESESSCVLKKKRTFLYSVQHHHINIHFFHSSHLGKAHQRTASILKRLEHSD